MRLSHIVICDLPGLQYFCTLFQKDTFFEEKLLRVNMCYHILHNICLKRIHYKRIEGDMIKIYIGICVKYRYYCLVIFK